MEENLIKIAKRQENDNLSKYLDILNSLNIEYEFCEVFMNSINIYCDYKKYKIKTLLKKHFNVLNIGRIGGLEDVGLDFYVDMDMVVYELELKK